MAHNTIKGHAEIFPFQREKGGPPSRTQPEERKEAGGEKLTTKLKTKRAIGLILFSSGKERENRKKRGKASRGTNTIEKEEKKWFARGGQQKNS